MGQLRDSHAECVTVGRSDLGVKLVEFSIAHISCSVLYVLSWNFGTNDEEGFT